MQEVLYSPGHQATWHHYLHGDQSEEAVGWLCRPERRPILVNSEHLRHLQELLEVYAGVTIADRPALSVANLSQSDPNLQAGQGALCVAVHLRVPAEEGSPPRVGHGLLTVKRQLQPAALGETLRTLTKLSGVLAPSGERGLEDAYLGFLVAETPQDARAAWLNYLSAFDAALPVAPISDPEHEWIPQSDARMPERIAILGRGPDDHGRILEVMAGLASVLYQSSVRWGELTTSRRVPADREGLVIQLLADSEPAALVERAVPLAELEGEVEDWITKVLPLRRTRIESASPFTDQSWSTSRRREVVNVPEINRPKPQRERLELPRERVELPATPTPEPRQRPRSAVDVVELPLRAPDPPRPVAPPPPPPQVQRAVSLDPPVPIAPLPVSLPPPPTLPPTNPDELHEPMSVRTPWDSSLSLPFNPPPPMVSEGPMVRSPNPRPMPPPVADFFGGAAAPPVDDEQIFAGDEDVSEEASSPSEPGIPSEPGLFAEPFEAPAPPPPAPPPPPPAPPPPPPRPAATLQDFIDEGQRPNVAPVEVPRSSGKGRRRPTVDESAPVPLSRQRSDTILAIGLDEDAPVPRSRPTPPPQRALDQNEESLEGPALLEAPLNRRSDSPVEAREVDPPTVAPQEGPPLPPAMPSKVERRPQPQAFVAQPLIPSARPAAEPDETLRSKAEVVKFPPKGQGRRKAEPAPVELSAEDYTPVAEPPPPPVVAPVPLPPRQGGNNAVRIGIAVLAGVAVALFALWITSPNKGARPLPRPTLPVEATQPPVAPPVAPPVETPPVADPGGEALPEVALETPPIGVQPAAVTQPPVAAVEATQPPVVKTPEKAPEKTPRTPKNTTPKTPTPPVEEPRTVVIIPATPAEPPPPTAGAVKLSVSGAGADRVDRVLLVKGGQRWDLKSGPVVPPGSYPVTVFFKGQSDTSGAGVIQVSGDTTVSLRCSAPEGGEGATPDCSASASRD